MSGALDLQELVGFSLVHVATRGDTQGVAAALAATLGVAVRPDANSVAETADGIVVLWFGPGRWLLRAPQPGWLPDAIDGCTATDLSDSRRIFRLSGAGVCDYLSRSCPLDLDATSTSPGSCALTQFDRFSVLLHRRAQQVFDLYVERSYATALPDGMAHTRRS
jgi:sarcosine oxidase subunit gamma